MLSHNLGSITHGMDPFIFLVSTFPPWTFIDPAANFINHILHLIHVFISSGLRYILSVTFSSLVTL